jgi:hypothetical protein
MPNTKAILIANLGLIKIMIIKREIIKIIDENIFAKGIIIP